MVLIRVRRILQFTHGVVGRKCAKVRVRVGGVTG